MNTNKYHRFILTIVAALGFAGSAFAGGDDTSAPAADTTGLLGQTYAGLTYSYIDLDGSTGHADAYSFNFNQTIHAGLDGQLSLDWTDAGSASQKSVSTGLRAFTRNFAWGTAYAEGGVGYAWQKTAGLKDDSFLWSVAVGTELRAAPAVTVTPYIKYVDAPSLGGGSKWDFGVKANYWVDHQWAVTVGLDIDDDHNTGFMVGTNFRF